MMKRFATLAAMPLFLVAGCDGINDLGSKIGFGDAAKADSFAYCGMVYDEFGSSLANAGYTRLKGKAKAAELKSLSAKRTKALALAAEFSSAEEAKTKYEAAKKDYDTLRKGNVLEVVKTMTQAKDECDQKLSAAEAAEKE